MKNRHLTIYVGDQEPRDKPAFLWIHRDPVTGYILFQINNGVDSWETITDSSMIAENMQHTLDILNDYIEDAQEAIEAAERLAQDMSTHAVPYIGDNGNWFTWNYQTSQYEDTGKQAKGDTGAQGIQGPQGETGPEGPTGPQGNTGSSVDYPYELVNNCTTDDATKGLAASQGVALKGEVSQLAQQLYGINVGTWEIGTIGVADVGTMEVPSVFTNYAIRTKNITALFSGNYTFTPGSGWEIRVLVANGKRTDNTFYSTPVTVAINEGDVFRLALRTIPQSNLSSNTSAQIQTLVANSGFSAISDGIVEIKSLETRVTKVEGDIEEINNILSSFSVGNWEVGAIGSAPVGTMTVPDVFTNYVARTKNVTAEKSGTYSFKIGSGWLVKLIVANGVRNDSNYYQEITQEIASGQVYRLAVKTEPTQTDFSTYTSAQLSSLIESAGFVSLINGENIALDIAKDAKEKADTVSENYTTVDLQTYIDNSETGYITYSGGTLQPHDGYRHTSPIPLKKGEKIVFIGDSVSICAVFASCDSDGNNCYPLMQGISPINETHTYEYYATNDTYIIISYVYHSDVTINTAKIVRDSFAYAASRGASLTTEAESGLISISDNPLSLVKETPGYSAAIRSWGFVGDSLASGVFFGYKDGVEWSDTNYDISWGQFMVRAMSAEGKNYSVGGQTAKWWVNNFLPPTDRSLAGVQADGGKQAYIIALGVNDAGNLSSLYGGKVATDMENISADIDFNTPANNANTFAGWYARVIQEIKAVAPDALIFPVVMPEQANETWANINTVIRSMQTIFATQYPNTIWTIDLYTYKPSQQYLSAFKMNGAHLNAQGYLYTAWEFMTYIDWLIRKNMSAFKGLCFIGTGAHINNDEA